jgi:hypothetical protein
MRIQHRSVRPGLPMGLLLGAVFATPVWVRGAQPLETVRAAFRASSRGITSGSGKGIYRYYEAVAGGDWVLKTDADISTHFDGKKYYIELTFHPDYRGLSCRRIIYDGRVVKATWFSPGMLSRGQTEVITPEDYGDGLSRPQLADFPWDVAKLSSNVWDVERLVQTVTAGKIEIRESREGDLIGSLPVINSDRARVRFECPKRFGFNIAGLQVFNVQEERPAQEYRVEWKQAPNGLWYVTSLQEEFLHRDDMKRFRRVMKYSEFEPNAKVDPRMFTQESL